MESQVLEEIIRHPKGIPTATLKKILTIEPDKLLQILNNLASNLQVELLSYSDGSHGVKACSKQLHETQLTMNEQERQVYSLNKYRLHITINNRSINLLEQAQIEEHGSKTSSKNQVYTNKLLLNASKL
jgi:hypothetical protein